MSVLVRRKWDRSVVGEKDRQHKLVLPAWLHPALPCPVQGHVMFFLSSFLPLSPSSCISTEKQQWLLAVGWYSPRLEAV